MRPKRILFAINQLYNGGAESSLVRFVNLLPQDKFDVSVVVYNHQDVRGIVSLIGQFHENVHLCIGHSPLLTPFVQGFVSAREFDLAISVGEWHTPELVMRYAKAKQKAIWLHADITNMNIPRTWDLFNYDEHVDFWIVVSNVQRKIMQRQLPFLGGRCVTVHNPVDADDIRCKAQESVVLPEACRGRKIVCMVGNLRPAKNYLRAVQTAAALKKKGMDAVWLVIGNFGDVSYTSAVRKEIERQNMQARFILLGAQSNPWRYMVRTDVFVSTSDTESWCMAVSEALALGKPVVSTATDGVSEQIRQNVNGCLCGFRADSLADGIVRVLKWGQGVNPSYEKECPPEMLNPVDEFARMIESPVDSREKAQALMIVDDVNYRGGAHMATMRMLKALREQGKVVDVLSGVSPTIESRNLYSPVQIRFATPVAYDAYLDQCSVRDVILMKDLPLAVKIRKVKLSLRRRMGRNKEDLSSAFKVGETAARLVAEYPCVCVMSEGSVYREFVSRLPSSVRKVQFIHTFYTRWRTFSEWTEKIAADDEKLYARMDKICLIGRGNAEAFAALYPQLKDKVMSFHNLIVQQSNTPASVPGVRLVTVARLEAEKDIPRMIKIARRLRDDGIAFSWIVYGDGPSKGDFEELVKKHELEKSFRFAGFDSNPVSRMREADLFVLLSHYEGLPNVIYESMIAGTPVLSTAVGGIPEQIDSDQNGLLVPDDDEKIHAVMKEVLTHPERIARWRNNLEHYRYDNEKAVEECKIAIFGRVTSA